MFLGEKKKLRDHIFIVCPRSDQPVCICPSFRALNNVKDIHISIDTITNRERREEDERGGGGGGGEIKYCHRLHLSRIFFFLVQFYSGTVMVSRFYLSSRTVYHRLV